MGDRTLAKARFVHDALSFETFAARKFAIIKHHQPETVLCGLIRKMLVTTAPEIPGIVTHDFLWRKRACKSNRISVQQTQDAAAFDFQKPTFLLGVRLGSRVGTTHTKPCFQVGEIKGCRDPHKTFKPSTLLSIRVAKSRI